MYWIFYQCFVLFTFAYAYIDRKNSRFKTQKIGQQEQAVHDMEQCINVQFYMIRPNTGNRSDMSYFWHAFLMYILYSKVCPVSIFAQMSNSWKTMDLFIMQYTSILCFEWLDPYKFNSVPCVDSAALLFAFICLKTAVNSRHKQMSTMGRRYVTWSNV